MMVDEVGSADHVGQQFGNYRLLRLLGVNRKASIYLGEHIHLKTQAVVKLYQLRLLHHDQHDFLKEARIIARLVHPHIVRVLDFGVEHDIPFLVIAYAPGGTLRQRYLEGTTLPLSMVISYMGQMAVALDYAHSQHVFHLGLNPDNIWLSRNNEILLDDFRIILFSQSSRSTNIEDIVGAVAYMAPEQIQGRACPASDQYAAGVITYEWLCGSRPFSGASYTEIARQHIQASAPPLASRVPYIPPAVEQAITRALAKDPDQRFPSLQAFADALRQSSLSEQKTVQYDVKQSDSLVTLPLSTPEPSRHANGFLSRRKVAIGIAGLAGAAVVAGSISWFVRSSPEAKPPAVAKPVSPGTTLHTYRGHADVVYGVDWSRDGNSIASWSRDDTMQVWDAKTFSLVNTYPMASVVSWSPDWRYIASGNPMSIQVWEAATGRILIEHDSQSSGAGGPFEMPVNSFVQWSPNGRYIAVTDLTYVLVWEVTTGKLLFSQARSAVSWSPDSQRIALRGINYSKTLASVNMQILDMATQDIVANYRIQVGYDDTMAWSPDGNYLAMASGQVRHAISGKHVSTYKKPMRALVWSPNSKYLASFDNSQNMSREIMKQLASEEYFNFTADSTVAVWKALTGEDVFVYRGHTAGVNDVAWSPDSTKIASASADTTVRIWQVV